MKKIFIFILVLALGYFGYLGYQKICQASPECACRNSTPGDPTCMSQEALLKWCAERKDKAQLPQCSSE